MSINNDMDFLNGCEVILRRDELQAQLDSLSESPADAAEWCEEHKEELDTLIEFCKDFEDYNAEALLVHECNIRDHIKEQFFERYANDATFDKLRAYIDMDKVVEDELISYSQVEFGDVTFYYI